MARAKTHSLSDVLDQLESLAEGETVAVQDVVDKLGHQSFAALMLVFALIAVSPASAIPGLTATVAVIVFILAAQMILGRDSVWLPGFITRRQLSASKLCKGIGWLRKPIGFVERFLGQRLTWLLHRPWLLLPLVLILGLTLFMPMMELIPTSGSIASAVIALFAAGVLARDGAVVLASMALLATLPLAIWYFGFGG
ncbi:exopolysaccharide biosynthesis protein [Falsiroseomonas tokyonensis]|uniref:Exopolysaccharide biosynthesis protein n=1 Tax=Falsiroseomonas tokyonensis TaxID=430521 RepID=A0ABV7C3V9_9PROT|nr:exopolysaccharide biosynthesis protein [Falsiroseomonas tokyonensis]MBU8540982.1 exopolysaccharide biosynthesis protein [Falsiroseomonas tokyonensis]